MSEYSKESKQEPDVRGLDDGDDVDDVGDVDDGHFVGHEKPTGSGVSILASTGAGLIDESITLTSH